MLMNRNSMFTIIALAFVASGALAAPASLPLASLPLEWKGVSGDLLTAAQPASLQLSRFEVSKDQKDGNPNVVRYDAEGTLQLGGRSITVSGGTTSPRVGSAGPIYLVLDLNDTFARSVEAVIVFDKAHQEFVLREVARTGVSRFVLRASAK